MPKKKFKTAKDPWADLSDEFRDSIEQGKTEDVMSKLGDIALANQDLMDLQEADLDLKDKKEQAKVANQVYADGFKANKLKIKFIKRVLSARGKA